ncbi:M24 family metallopeptidase [Halomonas elongata]|uniref:Peptidase M24 family protein n=1 Tax=Halomonas elongata (strain ATCC 33173 / DSM 2581 / NBRC 15536 / NCIMB 2198 / 1H9) TaxID=768066 RepID=E1V6L1_HALED|nr:Xaa-Pro peptidase family protein [Halomonas elongata]WBF18573.1 Xaa-Pro peptidase family protein [Halomonas elongata]WPU47427.1 Xaa-Pro peptidase family protein [Halomonas elongata DSM 2581]CBV41340.1 peptidase M24 family protein [Halomonas elongata DSM 2581]
MRMDLAAMDILPPTHDPAECEPSADEIPRILLDRLGRVRAELAKRDITAAVLFDPAHVRYATGSRNMQVYSSRNPARYAFVPAEGPVVLFEFSGCEHLASHLPTVDEIRPAKAISYYFNEKNTEAVTRAWADEIVELARQCGGGERLAIESATPEAAFELQRRGYRVLDAQEPLEMARAYKVPNEIKMVRSSLRAVEDGVRKLEAAIVPGVSENAVWAKLHEHIIATDADFVETRLMNSGPRTNPWFQECSDRLIRDGELVALDTDVVGRYGYYADFSRTFLCGDGEASPAQRDLYKLAYEQIRTNMENLKPGVSFKEYAERAWRIPPAYRARRYFALAHGVGMNGEYPYIVHREDIDDKGYDGIIAPGMTLCVESFIGHENGGEGVKLEEQLYVRDDGRVELLSDYPFDPRLIG